MPIFADRDPRGKLTGRWRAQVRVDGKNYKSTRFDTYEQAKKWEAEQRGALKELKLPKKRENGDVITLGDLYLRASGVVWRNQRSEETSELRLRVLLKMMGTETKLADIKTDTIDLLIAQLAKKKVKGSTINRYLSILRRFLDWGRERGHITALPVFDWQEEDQGRIRWITYEEEAMLYDLLDEKFARLVKVAIKTGMRRGELLSLEYEQLAPRKVHLWKTKSKVPRTIPIDEETHDDLLWLLDHKMPNEHELRWAWDQARAAMGLTKDPYFVFHVTRHTCATRLVEANVNLRVIQKWLGHARIETTIRYAQVADQMLEDALTKLTNFAHTHSNQLSAASKRRQEKVGLLGIYDSFVTEKTQQNQCGRGGTGRRAGFRSSSDTEESEE